MFPRLSSKANATQCCGLARFNADMSWAAFKRRPKEPQSSAPNGMRVSLFRFPREAERKPTILCLPHLETTGLCAFCTGDPLLACLCLWRHRRRVRRGAIKARTPRRAASCVLLWFVSCYGLFFAGGAPQTAIGCSHLDLSSPLWVPFLGWEDCLSGPFSSSARFG